MYKLEKTGYTNPEDASSSSYGFIVYSKEGKSLPKGLYSSYCAVTRNNESWVEFGIQSPTGDSSDHHNYSFPCVNFTQAKEMVDVQFKMLTAHVSDLNDQYLYA